ncbi:transposase [Streptomyces bobili]|uniref:transposase n=1 Tax=Streptomyces bobili TaxID=67280 RepID=UPI0033CC839C
MADKSNEIPAFAPLLETIDDLDGVVVTADALHTQHAHGTYLRSHGAHYLAIVKTNQAELHDRVRHLPWRDVPLEHYNRTRAHHRTCPAPWHPCATSPSASTARTAPPTWPPPSDELPATTDASWPPSDPPDEPGQDHFTQ